MLSRKSKNVIFIALLFSKLNMLKINYIVLCQRFIALILFCSRLKVTLLDKKQPCYSIPEVKVVVDSRSAILLYLRRRNLEIHISSFVL